MSDIEKQSGTRNAAILMILVGVLQIYSGFSFHQMAIVMAYPLHSIFGIFMICFGILSLCTSLLIWFQNSWDKKMIIIVGLAVCFTLLILGFFYVSIIFGAIYYIAWNQLKQDIEDVEWYDALDEE